MAVFEMNGGSGGGSNTYYEGTFTLVNGYQLTLDFKPKLLIARGIANPSSNPVPIEYHFVNLCGEADIAGANKQTYTTWSVYSNNVIYSISNPSFAWDLDKTFTFTAGGYFPAGTEMTWVAIPE